MILMPSIRSIGLTDSAMIAGSWRSSPSLISIRTCSSFKAFRASLIARLPSAST